jgi:two-component system nitrate/nitrite response regulator NarL
MRWRQSFSTILVGKSILLREGLAGILHSADFHILASVSRADDLPASNLQQQQQLFIVVHTGDDFAAAIDQIELFRERHPGGRIAVVADHYQLDELVSALRAGANGYFVDVMTCDAFIKSMELLMMGETIFPPALSFVLDSEGDDLGKEVGQLGEAAPGDENDQVVLVTTDDAFAPQLSPREKSILRCLIEGDSNKCIARKIDIAEATVKVHVKAILRKIRVHNRTQAAIWGVNHGSPIRPANNNSTPSTSDMSKRLPKPVEAISEIRQVETSLAPSVTHQANHLDDRLIRKSISRRTHSAARLGK